MQTKDEGKFNHCFYYSIFLNRVISHHPKWLEEPQAWNSDDGISWEQINVEALGYYSNSVVKECAFYYMPPSYWCIFWLTPNVTCEMCTMLWPVFFWPLSDQSGEHYTVLVTPDSWSCSVFPCKQSSHWFPDGHVQVRAAGSTPTMVKIDSYLVVFIKRRGRRALYNRRVWGVCVWNTGLFKTSSDSCFPWQELALQQGTKAGILPLLESNALFFISRQ